MKIDHNKIFKYYQKGIYPPAKRLIAFGDIHGDFNAMIITLKNAKLIDNNYHWIGGDTHAVQIGDVLDRKIRDVEFSDEDSEIKLISLICNIQLEAYIAGGGFHPVIGNHELMNILGVFDYVSPMGFKHFNSIDDRYNYFRIGNDFCKYLACAWNPIIKIGNFIFCHGGLSLNISNKYSIEDINFVMRDTLYGNISHLHKAYFTELFLDPESILWNRDFSLDASPNKEAEYNKRLTKILEKYDAKYLVLGHTPQDNIKMRFNNRVICIDTAMSEAFGKKNNKNERIHYLEISINNNQIILH